MQTVTFLAKNTNSAPVPQPPKPRGAAIELIAIANGVGVAWIFWETPAVALLLAVCVACVSLAMRQSFWAKLVSLVSSAAIACVLIMYPPVLIPKQRHTRVYYRPIAAISADYDAADAACERTGRPAYCNNRQTFLGELQSARKAAAGPPKPPEVMDDVTKAVLYAVAVAVLWVAHNVATSPGEAEIIAPPPILPKPPEDPDEKIKRKAFDLWFADRITAVSPDVTTPFDAIYADYKRALSAHIIPPKGYDTGEFKRVFKDSSGREPLEIKGVLVYQGITLTKAGLI